MTPTSFVAPALNHRAALPAALVLSLLLAAPGCTRRAEQADIDGQDVRVVILHTSDIHSRLVPYQMDVGKTDEDLGLNQANMPIGGISRLAAVVKQERRDNYRMAYIETGDVFQGAPIFNSFTGEPEFKALSQIGVDVFAIGNHEFDNGAIALVGRALQFAQFPMLGANYALGDWKRAGIVPTGQIAVPYHIINVKGIRIGVIGITYMGGYHGGSAKGVVPLRTRDVVQDYVDLLRPMVDLVAVASHVGYHEDQEMIPRTEGVDIVFGGHLHIALNPPNVVQDCDIAKLRREQDRYRCDTYDKQQARIQACLDREGYARETDLAKQKKIYDGCVVTAKEECQREEQVYAYKARRAELQKDIEFLQKRGCHPRDVLLVHSGAFLKYIGKLDLTLRQCTRLEGEQVCAERDANGSCVRSVPRRCSGGQTVDNDWEVLTHKYKLIPVDSTLPEDPQMVRLMEPYLIDLNRDQLLTQVLGFASDRIRRFTLGSGDSQLGNLVTDAMLERSQVWADFAVTNSLGIRSDLVAGPLDAEQMNNVFPFENSITVMYLSGYEVQEMMDFIAQRSASRGCQSQAQVAGISAKLICRGCAGRGGNSCARVDYDGEPCAQRVTIGGSGDPCAEDKDCATDAAGQPTGEICSSVALPTDHPARAQGKTRRCGMPLSCSRSYRLATNDYVAHGGSGFSILARNRTQQNLKIPLRDAATDYIVNMPACSRIPRTYAERLAGVSPSYVVSDQDRKALEALEKRARQGNDAAEKARAVAEAKAGYTNFVTRLKGRLAAAKGNERTGLVNYVRCIHDDRKRDPITGSLAGSAKEEAENAGVGSRFVEACDDYDAEDKPRCRVLGQIRAALRCITLPCIQAREDGRLERDLTRAPNYDDTLYPE